MKQIMLYKNVSDYNKNVSLIILISSVSSLKCISMKNQ